MGDGRLEQRAPAMVGERQDGRFGREDGFGLPVEAQALDRVALGPGPGNEIIVRGMAPAGLQADGRQAQEVVWIGVVGAPAHEESVRSLRAGEADQALDRHSATLAAHT